MENKEPIFSGTEEQKKKLKELRRSFIVNMALTNFKFMLTLFAANLVVVTIDGLYVQNQAFAYGGCFLNFFLSFRSYRSSLEKEHDRIKSEVKKILEN